MFINFAFWLREALMALVYREIGVKIGLPAMKTNYCSTILKPTIN